MFSVERCPIMSGGTTFSARSSRTLRREDAGLVNEKFHVTPIVGEPSSPTIIKLQITVHHAAEWTTLHNSQPRRTSALRFLPRRWSAWQRGGFRTPSRNDVELGGQCVFGAMNLSAASTCE